MSLSISNTCAYFESGQQVQVAHEHVSPSRAGVAGLEVFLDTYNTLFSTLDAGYSMRELEPTYHCVL